MAQIWVTKPGEENRLPEVEAEAARLQAELSSILKLSDDSRCRLCGVRAPLTKEHAPSKKAGNQGRMTQLVVDSAASLGSGILKWKKEIIHGVTYPALCSLCNNQTGAWYNPAYIKFARHCRALARPENAGKLYRFNPTFHLQRVAKQALVS